MDDQFEWDEAKAAANLREHGISFRTAGHVFGDQFVLVEQDLSDDYGEERLIAIGMVEGLLLTVVYAERGERIRIISARRATRHEQKQYDRSETPS